MRIDRPHRLLPVLFLVGLGGGCASTGSGDCRTPIGERGLTPERAAAEARIGSAITWGGALVSTRNLADATELEVLAYPLNDCGRPLLSEPARGRFIIRRPGYLETADLAPGRSVTGSGRIIDIAEGTIGAAGYRFPVLEDAAPVFWPEPSAGNRNPSVRPWVSVGIGGGRGWSGGGVGIWF
jgi:outer membrane lipoprotein